MRLFAILYCMPGKRSPGYFFADNIPGADPECAKGFIINETIIHKEGKEVKKTSEREVYHDK